MKKFHGLAIICLICTRSFATHNVAGEITYRNISGTTYEVTITTYTRISTPADRPELLIYWGDGGSDTIPRTNGGGNGVPVAPDIKRNVYTQMHVYPGPGFYSIYFEDGNYNAGILNMPGSVNVPYRVQSLLVIPPVFINNHSVQFVQMPSFKAALNHPYLHNVTAYDPDGDCLSYEMVAVSPGYSLPQAPNTFNIDSINGEITWDYPVLSGEYVLAVKIIEWRYGMQIGYVIRYFYVNVIAQQPPTFIFNGNGSWQVDANGNYAYILTAGDTLQLNLIYTDSLSWSFDLNAYSETFFLNDSASFSKTVSWSSVNAIYEWTPAVTSIRSAPYVVTFRGSSVYSSGTLPITSDITVLIYVLDANTTPCFITSSVEENSNGNLNQDITLYPNPSSTTSTISAPTFTHSTLSLYDITARLLLQQAFNEQATLDVSALKAGMYVVEVRDKEGISTKGKVLRE